MKVNAILLKPLDGYEPGSPRQFDKVDFDRLAAMNAVREAGATDEVEKVPDTEDALMLERLRHPADDPKILAELKARFEAQAADINRLTDAANASQAAIGALTTARDEAIRDRDAVIVERDSARDAVVAATEQLSGLQGELDTLRAGAPADIHAPAGKAKAGKA